MIRIILHLMFSVISKFKFPRGNHSAGITSYYITYNSPLTSRVLRPPYTSVPPRPLLLASSNAWLWHVKCIYTFFRARIFLRVRTGAANKLLQALYGHIHTLTSRSMKIVGRSQNIVCSRFVIPVYMHNGVALSCLERLSKEPETYNSVSKKQSPC